MRKNVVKVMGGLGNQMFQYAFARAVENRTGCETQLDLSWFDRVASGGRGVTVREFELTVFKNVALKISSRFTNKLCFMAEKYASRRAYQLINGVASVFPLVVHEEQDSVRGVEETCGKYFVGYWQGEHFFKEVSNNIRTDFEFPHDLTEKNKSIVGLMHDSDSVSVHVRRGDYVESESVADVHGICPIKYYDDAMKYMTEMLGSPKFFIFSDDPVWVSENFKNTNMVLINENHGRNSYIDMQLMSECKHNIIANSTFSWWGAWLNSNKEKVVIAPKKWFANKVSSDGLIPADWIRL